MVWVMVNPEPPQPPPQKKKTPWCPEQPFIQIHRAIAIHIHASQTHGFPGWKSLDKVGL